MADVLYGRKSCQSSLSEDLMDELFSCTICFLPFNETENLPKLLGCHHTFCRKCLHQLQAEDSETLKCPVCSEESRLERRGVDSLSTNYYLYKFTEVLKNLKLTDEGEHSLSSFSKDSKTAVETCLKHGNTEKYFWCSTCSEKVCIHCLGIDHSAVKNHQVDDLKQATDNLRKEVMNRVVEIKRKSSNIEHIKFNINSNSPNMLKVCNALQYIFQAPSKNCHKALSGEEDVDKTLAAITKCCATESFPHDPHALIAMKNQLEELLQYYVSIDEFFEQKYKEFRLLQDSKIMLSVIKPDVKFDYGKLYCIRCGELCAIRHSVEVGKENPCNAKFVGNYCKTCGIVMMEFS